MSIPQGKKSLAETHPDLAAQWSSRNEISPNEVTAGSNKRVWWVCDKGHEWQTMVGNRAISGTGCRACALAMPKVGSRVVSGINDLRTTHKELCEQWFDEVYSPEQVSAGSDYAARWKCAAGHTWYTTVDSRTHRGSGCPYCANRKILIGFNDLKTTNPILADQWSKRNHLQPTEVFAHTSKKVWWVCDKGHEWEASPNTRSSGHGCPYCSGLKSTKGLSDLISTHPELEKSWAPTNTKSMSEVSRGSEYRAKWVCEKGHEWESFIFNRVRSGCPKCVKRVSSQELEISTFLQLHGISPDDILLSTRKIIPPKELDIYLPSHNLAIEFNGLYWHSEESGKASDYHLSKHVACAERGIQLLIIWEDDWRDRRPIVERMLKEKLGISDEPRVAARKTKVVPLTRQEIAPFMQMYHIQGAASGSYYLGLKEKGADNLVAAMILTRRGDTLTLDRYATSCNVPGGHSKLIAYVQREIPFSSLITFADLCISDGALYEKTGWTRDTTLAPDYRYVYNGERVHKFNFRKKRFRDSPDLLWEEGLTERQLAELNGLQKVWDCGKIRYRQEKND